MWGSCPKSEGDSGFASCIIAQKTGCMSLWQGVDGAAEPTSANGTPHVRSPNILAVPGLECEA